MSVAPMFGRSRPRLNVTPLLLTPGFAAVGYVLGGGQGAWWGVAAWMAVVLGAAASCALHAWRTAHDDVPSSGRRPFDGYDTNNVEP
ncbi:MAG: hypothetical protein ABJD97_02330 [Betaproteobacteria bacterium]